MECLQRIEALLSRLVSIAEREQTDGSPDDTKYARVVHELVIDARVGFHFLRVKLQIGNSGHTLDKALKGCGATTSHTIGALFRTIRDRYYNGVGLVRDGRSWRLDRRTRCGDRSNAPRPLSSGRVASVSCFVGSHSAGRGGDPERDRPGRMIDRESSAFSCDSPSTSSSSR
jgi:hypothetical protein